MTNSSIPGGKCIDSTLLQTVVRNDSHVMNYLIRGYNNLESNPDLAYGETRGIHTMYFVT